MKRLASAIAASTLVLTPAVASAAAQKLLLSEVVVGPTEAEYVAITNPNATAVDLTNFYLADYETYYNVVKMTAPGGTDFVVRFPAGASIAPGAKQYVSIGGAECFKAACGSGGAGKFNGFGIYPTYEIETGSATKSSATVVNMLLPFTGAVGATRGLTNGGEPIILFYWDGASNLVTDVDYVYYGAVSSNAAVNKTGVTVNGSTYAADTADAATAHAPLSVPPTGGSTNTCRVDATEGTQAVKALANGIDGRDETSENSMTTWTACTVVTPTVADSDGDTIPDTADNCPTTANTTQLDTDADGLGDACDQCPTMSGPPANNGCPTMGSTSSAASSSAASSSSASSSAGVGGGTASSSSAGGTGGSAMTSSGVGGGSTGFTSSGVGVGGGSTGFTSSGVGGAGGMGTGGAGGAGIGGAGGMGTGGVTSTATGSGHTSAGVTTTTGGNGGNGGNGGEGGSDIVHLDGTGACGCTVAGDSNQASLLQGLFAAIAAAALGLRRRRDRR